MQVRGTPHAHDVLDGYRRGPALVRQLREIIPAVRMLATKTEMARAEKDALPTRSDINLVPPDADNTARQGMQKILRRQPINLAFQRNQRF